MEPYWELTFDAEGDVDVRQRDRIADGEVTDLLVFAHGWNNDRSIASRLYRRFYRHFPDLVADRPGVRLGYVGVLWPSMRFTDEPIPDLEPVPRAAAATRGLDEDTRAALTGVFPGAEREAAVDRIAELLRDRPESTAALEEFGSLVRRLVADPADSRAGGAAGAGGTDHGVEDPDGRAPGELAILTADTVAVCRAFTEALAQAGAGAPGPAGPSGGAAPAIGFGGPGRWWDGAQELLRQATYFTMKRRAGVVGERGLGPVLGRLGRVRPSVRVHLIGHSFGGRLVSYALRGLPEGTRSVKSLILLQGAFSHYAFAARLPHAKDRSGALGGMHRRVDGPVVSCHSRHDTALGVLYPLASRAAGDSAGLLGLDSGRWGAIGHGGHRAVAGSVRLTLDEALAGGRLPASGCVSVDAAKVVRRGGPPTGAHSDICHPELARVVLAAGRIGS
ncbi:serine-threonine protein kinase [Streptomyces sp. GC420]|nr:serine-threonine protein kinase [Streptomyces sp. GC420]